MVGKTLSLAESETKSENGTSQMHRPKYDAISVKVGIDIISNRERGAEKVGFEKCLNQK